MAGVDQVDFSVGNLAFVSLRFRGLKRLIVVVSTQRASAASFA